MVDEMEICVGRRRVQNSSSASPSEEEQKDKYIQFICQDQSETRLVHYVFINIFYGILCAKTRDKLEAPLFRCYTNTVVPQESSVFIAP